MKRIIALVLLLCCFAFCAHAETFNSSLGYTLEIDESVWTPISPDTLPVLSAGGWDGVLSSLGFDDAYFSDFENRSHEMLVDFSGVYGNIIIRQISEENTVDMPLEEYAEEMSLYVVPYYEDMGFTVEYTPAKVDLSDQEWVIMGLFNAETTIYQCMTINPYTGRWFNLTFTRVPFENILAIVQSFSFTA